MVKVVKVSLFKGSGDCPGSGGGGQHPLKAEPCFSDLLSLEYEAQAQGMDIIL